MTAEYVTTRMVPLDQLQHYPGNARVGRVDMIRESLRTNGQFRSLIVRETGSGELIVIAGNHTLMALIEEQAVQARCEIYRTDDQTALRINLVDNKAADHGTYDDEARALLLRELDDFEGTGYDFHDLDSAITAASMPEWAEGAADELVRANDDLREVAAPAVPDAPAVRLDRTMPVDAILTLRFNSIGLAAHEMGFLLGSISTDLHAARRIHERLPGVRMGFIDNEWHDYKHDRHVAAIAEIKPKYATVRDIMTRQQCEQEGVEFIPVDRVLEMAEEVQEHCDHVIVIPKYDCLDKIPEKYVIGFSVPTSYGRTPMPAELLRGRRVHLLGGSWAKQRRYLALLGDDVVSFDNNNLSRVATFGQFCYPDGTDGRFNNISEKLPRTWQAAAILSLASIRTELNNMFKVALPGSLQPQDGESDQVVSSRTGEDEDSQ